MQLEVAKALQHPTHPGVQIGPRRSQPLLFRTLLSKKQPRGSHAAPALGPDLAGSRAPVSLSPPHPSSEAATYSPCLWAGPSSKPAQSNTSAASHMWPLSARNVVLMDVCCTHGTHTQDLEACIQKRMQNISIILYSGYILR